MQAVEERVASHYTREDLYDAILAALEKAGQPVETVSIDDLAPVTNTTSAAARLRRSS